MLCKYCNSNKVNQVDLIQSPYYNNINFTLYECKNCTSRFFDFNQHLISINEMYENLAKDKISQASDFSTQEYWLDQKQNILKLMNGNPSSILDIGCRTGDFLMHFDKTIKREGVEISNYCAEIATKRGLRIYNQNIENLNLDTKYDIITAYNILEHLINPIEFLKRILSIINENGLLVILIPTHECLKVKLLKKMSLKWHMYVPPEHLNFFSKAFLDSFMKYHGFKLIKRYYSSGGLFNPFKKMIILNSLFSKFMYFFEKLPINRLPIFDHLFSYYKKIA